MKNDFWRSLLRMSARYITLYVLTIAIALSFTTIEQNDIIVSWISAHRGVLYTITFAAILCFTFAWSSVLDYTDRRK